ncbi:hypothetical protein MMC11_002013 [Xylographa trunciseda]|nr:hypothetical protein [Xylographa trunciseda]
MPNSLFDTFRAKVNAVQHNPELHPLARFALGLCSFYVIAFFLHFALRFLTVFFRYMSGIFDEVLCMPFILLDYVFDTRGRSLSGTLSVLHVVSFLAWVPVVVDGLLTLCDRAYRAYARMT